MLYDAVPRLAGEFRANTTSPFSGINPKPTPLIDRSSHSKDRLDALGEAKTFTRHSVEWLSRLIPLCGVAHPDSPTLFPSIPTPSSRVFSRPHPGSRIQPVYSILFKRMIWFGQRWDASRTDCQIIVLNRDSTNIWFCKNALRIFPLEPDSWLIRG